MKIIKNYRNINNLDSVIRFMYYVCILFTFIGLITLVSIPFLPDSAISFKQGLLGWVYSIELPIGTSNAFFSIQGDIPKNILQFIPVDQINITAAIFINSIFDNLLSLIIIIFGLKKLLNLTTAMLKKETPFQLKYIKSLRQFSYVILLYSTLSNTILCLLNSLFVVDFFYFTFDFIWTGVLFGIVGYIFSDITEHGLFLQDEYDATL